MELLVAAATQRNGSVDPTGRSTRNQMEKVALAVARAEAQERVVDLVVILVVQVDARVDVLEVNQVDIQVVLVDVLEVNQVVIQVAGALQTEGIALGTINVESIKSNF
jgi:hypothetical protein